MAVVMVLMRVSFGGVWEGKTYTAAFTTTMTNATGYDKFTSGAPGHRSAEKEESSAKQSVSSKRSFSSFPMMTGAGQADIRVSVIPAARPSREFAQARLL